MSGYNKNSVNAKRDSISDKILAMREKIEDSSYVNNAVQIIALALSKRLVEQPKVY